MLRLLIADDHVLVREGLKRILQDEPDMQVAGEAGNAREVLNWVTRDRIDVLILDISMPGRSGLDLIPEVKARNPAIAVLLLSIHPEECFATRGFKSGASGYLNKECAVEELVTAIRKVQSGRKYVSSTFAEKLVANLSIDGYVQRHETLTHREFEVMRLLAGGKSVRSIADDLALSSSTVNTYRSRIFQKLCIKANAELTRYALQNDLID